MISEFEKILDEADKAIGTEKDKERLFGEVYVLMNQFEKDSRTVRLQQVIFSAKQFEVAQNLRKPCADSTITAIATMGTTLSADSPEATTLSRAERRYMKKMNKKSGRKSATKRKKK